MAHAIVAAWQQRVCQTSQTYASLRSCRDQLDAQCPWADIGAALQQLLDTSAAPLRPLSTLGTAVVLARYGTRLVAVKQHVLTRGAWEVEWPMLRESRLLQELAVFSWSPQLAFVSVTPDLFQLGLEYLPWSMDQLLALGHEPPHVVLHPLLTAVQALHQHGVAHRDLKPDNIRFRATGELVLIDYDASTWLTAPNGRQSSLYGTPAYRDPYLSDPQCDRTQYDDRWMDAFAIGAIGLFVCTGGTHVFARPTAQRCVDAMRAYVIDDACPPIPLPERELLRGLLVPSTPSRRSTLTQALEAYHPRSARALSLSLSLV